MLALHQYGILNPFMAGKRSPVLPVNTLLITGRGQFHGPISELDTSRDGAIILSDLIGKLDLLRVSCEKCGRDGSYRLNGLIEKRGRDAKLIDWLDELTAECPKKIARNMNDWLRFGESQDDWVELFGLNLY